MFLGAVVLLGSAFVLLCSGALGRARPAASCWAESQNVFSPDIDCTSTASALFFSCFSSLQPSAAQCVRFVVVCDRFLYHALSNNRTLVHPLNVYHPAQHGQKADIDAMATS